MRRLAHVLIVVVALPIASALAASAGDSTSAALPYDPSQWDLVKTTKASLGRDVGQTQVYLLKSKMRTAWSGTGDPMFSIQVLVTTGGRVLYRYLPGDAANQLYVEPLLEVRSIAMGMPPVIVFSSGVLGASDWDYKLHILRAKPNRTVCEDVALPQFEKSWRHPLSWLTTAAHTYVVTATPKWPDDPMLSCHSCAAHYQYTAYEWSEIEARFVAVKIIESTRDFDGEEEPLEGDWGYIRGQLL